MGIRKLMIFFIFICIVLLKHNTNTFAKETSEILTLKQAISLAISKNPALEALSFEQKKAKGRILQAGLLPNPKVSLEIENFEGSDDFRDFESAEKTLILSQDIQLGDKRGKRKKIAKLEEDLISWDINALRLDIIKEVSQAFFDVLGAQDILKLNIELTQLAEKVHHIVREKVHAGKITPLEEIKAKANLMTQEIQLNRAKKDFISAKNELAATWGSKNLSFKNVEGNLELLAPLLPLKELKKGILQNPDMARWKSEKKHRQALVDAEKSKKYPDLEIAGGIRKFEETDDYVYVMGFSFPLMVFDRNQGTIMEALQSLSQVEREKFATEISLIKELNTVYQEATTAFNEATALKNNILPGMKKVFISMQEGFHYGKFSYLEVLDAQRSFFESKKRYLESLVLFHKASVEIERLVGDHQFKKDIPFIRKEE
ncbi:MAG: TolC family protein [Thermodesulfobacteriota bacterium]|nr:TolC family protein [Thermodesulfobacteriota bacterium]